MSGLKEFGRLLRRLFSCRERTPSEQVCVRILQTRTLISHAIFTFMRIGKWALGTSYWLQEIPKKCNEVSQSEEILKQDGQDCLIYDYNEDLVEAIRPTVQITIMAALLLSAILDIITYKFRHLAHAIFYIEIFLGFVQSLIPSVSWNSFDSMSINLIYLIVMLLYYTDHVGQVIYLSFMHCILRFGVNTIVYHEISSLESAFNEGIYIVSLLVVNIIFATLFVYIASLHDRMRRMILQNAKLLNGMHEGLLILSKLDQSILFVNRPAQKLLTSVIDFKPKKAMAKGPSEGAEMTKTIPLSVISEANQSELQKQK